METRMVFPWCALSKHSLDLLLIRNSTSNSGHSRADYKESQAIKCPYDSMLTARLHVCLLGSMCGGAVSDVGGGSGGGAGRKKFQSRMIRRYVAVPLYVTAMILAASLSPLAQRFAI